MVVGGEKLAYPDDPASPAANLLDTKLIINSTISDSNKGARFMTVDVKNFFLGSEMPRPEYMKIPFSLLPPDIILRYNLHDIVHNNYIYIQINKGMREAGAGAWRFLKMPTEANLCLRLNDVDTFLLNTFIEEINVISNRVLSKIETSENIMMQIVGLFLDPVISGWVDAANAGNTPDDAPLTHEDMYHFIETLAYLSFY